MSDEEKGNDKPTKKEETISKKMKKYEEMVKQTEELKTRLENTKEKLLKVETNSKEVQEMVDGILGDTLDPINNYINLVSSCFFEGKEILDDDLNKIILRIPVYIYSLVVFSQEVEMRKGVAKEQASYTKSNTLVTQNGTAVEKTAWADMASLNDRIVEIAYKTASAIVQKTIDGANSILDSAKKVQQQRQMEKKLTALAGSAVGGTSSVF